MTFIVSISLRKRHKNRFTWWLPDGKQQVWQLWSWVFQNVCLFSLSLRNPYCKQLVVGSPALYSLRKLSFLWWPSNDLWHQPLLFAFHMCVLCIFPCFRQGLIVYPEFLFGLPNVEITGVHHHTWLDVVFYEWLVCRSKFGHTKYVARIFSEYVEVVLRCVYPE